MSANWLAIEDAFAWWVEWNTTLTAVWANQNAGQPPGDFITLQMDGPTVIGHDVTRYITDLSRPAGSEIELRIVGERECSLLVQAFTRVGHGALSANKYIAQLQTSLSLPTVVETFRLAGISVFDVGPVQNIPALLDADIHGRASMRLGFYLRDSVSDFTGFIQTVNVTDSSDT